MLGLPAKEALARAKSAGREAVLVSYQSVREIPGADDFRVIRVKDMGEKWELTVSPFKTRL